MGNGHPHAQFYPLRRVWEESALVVQRLNGVEATRAILLNKAVSAVVSKKAGADFKKTIKSLTDSE